MALQKYKLISIPQTDTDKVPPGLSITFFDAGNHFLESFGRVDAQGFARGKFWLCPQFGETLPTHNGYLYGPLDEDGLISGSSSKRAQAK